MDRHESVRKDRKCLSTHSQQVRKRPAGFKGTNRHSIETDTTFASTSAAKIARESINFDVKIDQTLNYCFVEFCLVFGTLQQLLKCKKCDSDVKFNKKSIHGLGFKICVDCSCSDPAEINSCPLIAKAYEINRRFCFVMRILGVGLQGINKFVALMDLGSCYSTTYYEILNTLQIAVKTIYGVVIKKAGIEEKQKNSEMENEANILTVSGDGSWSMRVSSSRMVIVSVIGKYTNKVLDVVVRSSFCKACSLWEGKEKTIEFETWNATHESECNLNREGNAGKMEVDGMQEIFNRSEQMHKAKYGFYIGNGDTKTFEMLLEAKPYGESFVIKLKECTGANTQNNNESFNHCISQLAPKHISCGKQVIEIATCIAVCIFNEGYDPILKIMEAMGVTIGPTAANFVKTDDAKRITDANSRSSLDSKDTKTARRNKISINKD